MTIPTTVSLRSAEDNDETFLLELFTESRASEFESLGLPAAQLQPLLSMQFRAQQASYQQSWPKAEMSIVSVEGNPVGQLYVDRSQADGIRIVDVSLLPRIRNRGIGTQLLTSLIDEAHSTGKIVRLHVHKQNQAIRLYQRLGFQLAESQSTGQELYVAMECKPPEPSPFESL